MSRVDFDLKTRGVLAELSRREAARLRVTITTKSGGMNSPDAKEIIEHAVYLESTADALVGAGDDKPVMIPVRAEENS